MNGSDKIKTQFSLRAVAALTAAMAVWVWCFRELKPVDLAALSGIAVTAGIVAHAVYSYWLRYRMTAIVTVLLFYNGVFLVLALCDGNSNPMGFLQQIAVEPVQMIRWLLESRSWNGDTVFLLVILLGTCLFTPAHLIRPSLPTAIITALGVGFWYGNALLMLSHAA